MLTNNNSDKRSYNKLPKGATHKVCSSCGKDLPLSEFYSGAYRNGSIIYHPKCKECDKQARRVNYKENRNHSLTMQKQRYAERITHRKSPCVICGETRLCAIDFHHIDPEQKKYHIGGSTGIPDDELDAEIEKCVCICSNCHREFHHTYGFKMADPVAAWEQFYTSHCGR